MDAWFSETGQGKYGWYPILDDQDKLSQLSEFYEIFSIKFALCLVSEERVSIKFLTVSVKEHLHLSMWQKFCIKIRIKTIFYSNFFFCDRGTSRHCGSANLNEARQGMDVWLKMLSFAGPSLMDVPLYCHLISSGRS